MSEENPNQAQIEADERRNNLAANEKDGIRLLALRNRISSRHDREFAFAICGKRQASPDVINGQLWKIPYYFLGRHSRSQIFKYVRDGNSKAANTRLTSALPRLNGDSCSVVHNENDKYSDYRRQGILSQ